MKNLIIRHAKTGTVVDFKKGEGENIENYRWCESEGYVLEPTDKYYTKKWQRWWETYEGE